MEKGTRDIQLTSLDLCKELYGLTHTVNTYVLSSCRGDDF
jgi:hypothetical protein